MNVFPAKMLNNLYCCKCFCVLSTGPIYCGPDGASVCGRCPPSPDDVHIPPLEAFLKKYSFPCRYQGNDCQEIVPFDEKEHEEQCQFKVRDEPPIEIFDKTVLNDLKCFECQKLLTVGPLSLTREGKSICGRCARRWSEMHVEEPLIRAWKLEYIMKRLPLPCVYYNLGCKRAFKWGEIEEHEDFCPHRPHSCPSTPYGICESIIPAGELYSHFEKEHSALLLTSPSFRVNLGQDCDTHRILRIGNHLFLLMTRVRVDEKRMWFSAALVGDVKMSKEIKYILEISNSEETHQISYAPASMQSDIIFEIDKKSATSLSFNSFAEIFRTNLQEIICNVTVEEFVSVEPNWISLKHCKWNECRIFGIESFIKRHETEICLQRSVKCKWDSCDLRMSFKNVAEHETICGNEMTLCKIDNCNREYPRSEIEIHESQCDFKLVPCKWTNCGKEYQLNEMNQHELECEERIISCRFLDCNANCLPLNWNLHIQNCEHLFTQKYYCGICLGFDEFLPSLLTQHFLTQHPNNICEGPYAKRTANNGDDDWMYFQYDGLLFWGCCKFNTDGGVEFYLGLNGASKVRPEYKYTFQLIHSTDPQKTIAEEHEMNDGISKSSDDLISFVKDDCLIFEFTIIKK